ncbi:hypothetical protein KR084_003983, partial [Drosophila pseudotakahashii]
MRSVLVYAEVWKVVNEARPDEEPHNWDAFNQKALAMITLSVRPTQLGYLKNCTTATDAWTLLKDVHEPSGPARKVSLYKKLLGLRMTGEDGMCE